MNHWGYLQSVDLMDCPRELLTDVNFIKGLLLDLCDAINMVPYGSPVVERFGEGSLEGVSGFLFIMTSSITIHCDEVNNQVFIDIFSCKSFNHEVAINFLIERFRTDKFRQSIITRG